MKQLLAIVAVLVLMVSVNAVPPASLTTEGSSALSTFLGDAVARGDVPGVVALVVDRDKVLYHEAFGKQNVSKNVPMAKDTIFTGEIMDSACAKGGGHESMFKKMGTDDPKACTEACLKGGSKYVLFKADKTFYQLDDQKKPASFAGQKVEVKDDRDGQRREVDVESGDLLKPHHVRPGARDLVRERLHSAGEIGLPQCLDRGQQSR